MREIGGRRCGTIGHLACFSFYPGKNLGAYGDAGAVTGNDPELLDRVRKLRDHGRTTKYEHDEIGYGERIDALQAAILGAKLPAPRGVDRGPPPSRRPLRRSCWRARTSTTPAERDESGTSSTSTSCAPNVGTPSWST